MVALVPPERTQYGNFWPDRLDAVRYFEALRDHPEVVDMPRLRWGAICTAILAALSRQEPCATCTLGAEVTFREPGWGDVAIHAVHAHGCPHPVQEGILRTTMLAPEPQKES